VGQKTPIVLVIGCFPGGLINNRFLGVFRENRLYDPFLPEFVAFFYANCALQNGESTFSREYKNDLS
jgi:hypothetical protein